MDHGYGTLSGSPYHHLTIHTFSPSQEGCLQHDELLLDVLRLGHAFRHQALDVVKVEAALQDVTHLLLP